MGRQHPAQTFTDALDAQGWWGDVPAVVAAGCLANDIRLGLIIHFP